MHKLESLLKNEIHIILWDFEIQKDYLIPARRPDLITKKEKKKKKKEKKKEKKEKKTEYLPSSVFWVQSMGTKKKSNRKKTAKKEKIIPIILTIAIKQWKS